MNILAVSSSPHIRSAQSTRRIMGDVLIALFPCLFAGIWVFGLRAFILTLCSTASCVLSEYIWNKINKKENTTDDLSACVTGMLVALILPVSVPLWVPVVGGVFAIIICKQLFGGLGQNFVNPALAARAFLVASWPIATTVYVKPFIRLPFFATPVLTDAVTTATPLALIKSQNIVTEISEIFVGNVSGCIGETSAIAIFIGAVYLVARKVITLYAPLAYIISSAVFGWIMGYNGIFTGNALFTVLSGGLLFGGFFMLTDYVTTPSTKKGMVLAGIIAGFITILIRVKGGYPEGTSYAILIVNVLTPIIEKHIVPKKYGRVKNNG